MVVTWPRQRSMAAIYPHPTLITSDINWLPKKMSKSVVHGPNPSEGIFKRCITTVPPSSITTTHHDGGSPTPLSSTLADKNSPLPSMTGFCPLPLWDSLLHLHFGRRVPSQLIWVPRLVFWRISTTCYDTNGCIPQQQQMLSILRNSSLFIITLAPTRMGWHHPHACLRSCLLFLLYSTTFTSFLLLVAWPIIDQWSPKAGCVFCSFFYCCSIIWPKRREYVSPPAPPRPHLLFVLYHTPSIDSWLIAVCLSLINSHQRPETSESLYFLMSLLFLTFWCIKRWNQQRWEQDRYHAPATDP